MTTVANRERTKVTRIDIGTPVDSRERRAEARTGRGTSTEAEGREGHNEGRWKRRTGGKPAKKMEGYLKGEDVCYPQEQ